MSSVHCHKTDHYHSFIQGQCLFPLGAYMTVLTGQQRYSQSSISAGSTLWIKVIEGSPTL